MKKMKYILIGSLLSILIGSVFFIKLNRDNDPPNIIISLPESGKIVYDGNDNKDVLLTYAQAIDEEDGDVSYSLLIEDIYVSVDLKQANVMYVARDKSNNVTRFCQLVEYIPTQEEVDELALLNAKKADMATETTTETATTTTAENTQASTEEVVNPEAPVIVMIKSEVDLAKGSEFVINRYIEALKDDKDDSATLYKRLIVKGAYNMKVLGNYTITLYCTDVDGNKSNTETFIIHVKNSVANTTTQATEAVTQATEAATQATEAATQATEATTQATEASTTEAATQATEASTTEATIEDSILHTE